MNYNIRGENIEVTPALKDHVERKRSASWNDISSRASMPM